MKTRLALTLAGLVTCLAISAMALSGDLAGKAGALEQLNELSQKLDSAINEQNALALAGLFTRDAVWVTPHGIFSGQGAIEEGLKSEFEQSPTTGHILQTDQLHSMGNEAWSVGQWWKILRGSSGSVFVSGYWSAIIVQEGDAWKFRMLTLSEGSRLVVPPSS
jgi:ketosteroid isomerase-like protein